MTDPEDDEIVEGETDTEDTDEEDEYEVEDEDTYPSSDNPEVNENGSEK